MKSFRVRQWLRLQKKKVVRLNTEDVNRLGTDNLIKLTRIASKKKISTNIVTQKMEDFLRA
jgi:hypothetical protein